MNLHKFILKIIEEGVHILPLRPKGKEAILKNWQEKASCKKEDIDAWFKETNNNAGILTGTKSKIVVIDWDLKNGGRESLEALEAQIGPLRSLCKYIVKSGGGGGHLFFKQKEGQVLRSRNGLLRGLDFRAEGGYIVSPFSVHPNGNLYMPLIEHEDKNLYVDQLSELPDYFVNYLNEKSSHSTYSSVVNDEASIPEGQRNERMFKLASSLRRNLFSAEAVYEALKAENNYICKPPLGNDELSTIVKSIEKYKPINEVTKLVMSEDAFYGLAGKMAMEISPINGISKEAVLFQFLICMSTLCAHKFFYSIGGKRIYSADYLVLVGNTGSSKKGTSFSDVKYFFDKFYPEFSTQRLKTGVNSGEGLINSIRDRVTSIEKNEKGKEREVTKDEGALSKIVLFLETEFSRLLKAGKRDGSTVTECYRNAWDGVPLEINTSQRSIRSTDYCVSLIAHITPKELRSLVSDIDSSNGYLNRFMFCLISGGEPKPFPESFDRVNFSFINEFSELLSFINSMDNGEVVLADNAKDLYLEIYNEFYYRSEDKITELISRNTQHLLKMAMLYAIIDQSPVISNEHLKAAKALIDYSAASIQELFGNDILSKKESKVLKYLSTQEGKSTRGKIQSDCFKNNSSKEELDSIQESLIMKKMIEVSTSENGFTWELL